MPSGPGLTLPRVTTRTCTPCASRWIQSHPSAGLWSTTLPLGHSLSRSGHEVTALVMPVVNGYNLESLGFRRHRSGTLWYWLRRGRGKSPAPRACPPLRNRGSDPPIVFCHGVGVNLLPYAGLLGPLFSRADEVHFINELLRLSRSISQLI